MIEITHDIIHPELVSKAAAHPEAGAVNAFIGTVRNQTGGKKVVKLEYEAYEPMVKLEIEKIIRQANNQWTLKGWAISHRVGTLLPGDVAVVVAVATAHRKDCFTACQFIIDSLKQTVPIWKKEYFEDGSHWVSAHP